jgi:hypothetical protein
MHGADDGHQIIFTGQTKGKRASRCRHEDSIKPSSIFKKYSARLSTAFSVLENDPVAGFCGYSNGHSGLAT